MKYLFIIVSLLILASCKNDGKNAEDAVNQVKEREDYEKEENGVYRSFYGSNNQLKIEGYKDKDGNRHGVWIYYNIDGSKISVTEYKHGKKDGYIVVYHPNGGVYYRGEFQNDEKVGEWDFYNPETGQKEKSESYGYPK